MVKRRELGLRVRNAALGLCQRTELEKISKIEISCKRPAKVLCTKYAGESGGDFESLTSWHSGHD